MIHPNTVIKTVSPEIGIGVFATHCIPKGTIVVVRDQFDTCLTQTEFQHMAEPMRSFMETYLYHDKHGNLVLSWDHARYMNHSCNSNTMMTDYHLEIAVRDIAPGEELTTEYGLLNIQEPYELFCHCDNCRKALRLNDIDVHAKDLDKLIQAALHAVPLVDQPLWPLLTPNRQERLQRLLQGSTPYSSVRSLKWRRPKKG
jgi:hypothetical protein